jgi:hypothetical protein
LAWVIIAPVTERDCFENPEDYEKWDNAAYRVLGIHAEYAMKHLEVEKVFKEDACPDCIREWLAESKADVLAFGHGWHDLITTNNCQIWLKADELPEWVKDRAFVFVACLTGDRLGPALIEKGAKAFFGLEDVGLLPAYPKAKYCRFFYAPFIGLLEAAISYQKGMSVEKCAEKALLRWKNEIEYWMNFYDEEVIQTEDGEIPVTAEIAQLLVACMMWNSNIFVAYPIGVAPTAVKVVAGLAVAAVVAGALWYLTRRPAPKPGPEPVHIL